MKPERYQRIRSIYFEASASKAEARAAVLDRACGRDAELRSEVERLLAEHDSATLELNDFIAPADYASVERAINDLQRGGGSSDLGAAPSSSPGLDLPSEIAGYRIERLIGSGGMGAVYAAQQQNPRRTVALKVMRPGVASGSALRRFEFEARVLAHLRHPGIAQIYAAGTFPHRGVELPFFVMEYIPDAETLLEFAARRQLRTRDKLKLFQRVCEAVQYGHQRGVIHRDLKPANVLVDGDGSPRVIDFGVARAVDSDLAVTSMQTDTGQLVGTLQYMSPEQIAGRPDDIDVRSDGYALGVMLYELLCGAPPYDVKGLSIFQAGQVVKNAMPARPGTFERGLRGEIETIILKALEKEPGRRYPSVAELSQDIERFLSGRAIQARPPSAVYQLSVLARRHRGVVVAGLLAILVLIGGFVTTTIMYLKADRQARIARAVNEFLNEDLLSSPQPRRLGIDASMRDVLAAASERIEGRFADEPEVEAAVRRTIGESYRNLGEFAAAVMHLSRAVELFEAQLGLETVTLESMNSLASLYYAMGKYDDSERLTRRVLHVAVPDPGLEDPISLVASQNLGLLEYRRGNLPEAIRILEACVETAERTDGPESDRTIGFLQNLAVAYSRNGDNEQLAELSKQMWTICERRHGPRHPDTINNAANYATALVELDRPAEAEPILETALDASRAVFGPSNVDTLYTMNALARVKDELGRVEEALSLYRETLDLRRKTLGTNHTSTVSSLINLTKLLTKQNRLDEALPLALEAKLVNAEINAAPDLKTVLIDTMLGDIYDKQADRQRAKTAYEAAIASARALGGNQVYLGRALARYGGLLHRDRPLEAEPSLREAQRIFERELGPDHENTREVVLKLSDIQAAGH